MSIRQIVSATELAKMGKCERQLLYDAKYGENHSLTARFIDRGNLSHEQFIRRLTVKKRGWFARLVCWLLRILRGGK